jgi:E3 ubiquitin-protein ligase HERC2
VYAWGDNDHGQQGNSTTTVNRKPAPVQGIEAYSMRRVACGSSHSVAWCTSADTASAGGGAGGGATGPGAISAAAALGAVTRHEPVLFSALRDPLGAAAMAGEDWLASLHLWPQLSV